MHLWNTCDNTSRHTPAVPAPAHVLFFFFLPPVIVVKPMAFTISQSSSSIYPRPFFLITAIQLHETLPKFDEHLWNTSDWCKRLEKTSLCKAVRKALHLKSKKVWSFIQWKAWWKDDDVRQLGLPFALYPKGSARTENELCKRMAERENESLREQEKEFITVNANEMFPAYNSLSLSALIKEEA